MTRFWRAVCGGLLGVTLSALALTPEQNQQTAVCQFEDGGQVSVRYEPAPANGDKPPEGKAWTPGESPMYLFTSTELKAGETEIPVGAYSLYVIPEKGQWTLVINKDVSGKNDDKLQDVARVPMDLGTVNQAAKDVSLTLGHIAPKQCSLRLYYGKVGAWAVLTEP